MIGIDVLKQLQAPALDEADRPITTVVYSVPCERCGREVGIALNALRAPSFHRVDEQVECPEIQERRSKGDGGLLLMMCRPLKQSLDARCDAAAVTATAPDAGRARRVCCSIPGVSTAQYSPNEARSLAEIWQAHGQAKLATSLRAAAATAERSPLVRTFAATGLVGALLLGPLGGWFMVTRKPAAPPPSLPAAQLQAAERSEPPSDLGPADAPPRSAAALPALAATDPTPARSQNTSEAAMPARPAEMAPGEAPVPGAPAVASTGADAAPAVASTAAPAPTPEEGAKVRLPDIVMIPGGAFAMGGVESAELPVHRVTIKPFALGKYPVTVGEWKECVTDKACADVTSGPDDNPVTNVSYDDAKAYLAWLSRVVGKPFRLPTEAEWEYAARGGATTKFWWGDQMRAGMAGCSGCNDAGEPSRLMKVGSFQANPFGLFDMGGCVDQWVADSWHKTYQGAPSDGSAWTDEQSFVRVIRSGSWKNDASYVRSGSRDHYDARVRYPTHGFRVALSL
ncbi:formylglycine-generating enzyme family protein [Bradyrhizobium oligotrophicum]|nr:formylglycine-generating enzyme family protein [Bradyrhizobium oligotrophicum]